MKKKRFIKGTDFELKDAHYSSLVPNCIVFSLPDGLGNEQRFAVPSNWVEEREVVRPEPTERDAIEVDRDGRPWWRGVGGYFPGQWVSSYRPNGNTVRATEFTWKELQMFKGPTRPAKVVDDCG